MEIPGVRSYEELQSTTAPKLQDKALGKSAFLELMITQIRNQDPLDPAKNEDFVAQLAQFSSLEGIQNMNQSMESMATAFRTSMTLDSAAMVGRSVLVPTDTVLMGQDQLGFVGSIDHPEASGKLLVDITNAAGGAVRTIDLGAREAGTVRFGWDGKNISGQEMPPGIYKVQAYSNSGGTTKPFTVEMPDRVVSVSIKPEGTVANLASGDSIPVSQIREIQ